MARFEQLLGAGLSMAIVLQPAAQGGHQLTIAIGPAQRLNRRQQLLHCPAALLLMEQHRQPIVGQTDHTLGQCWSEGFHTWNRETFTNLK